MEQGLRWWDRQQYRGQQTRYPVVPGVQCLAYLGVILWLQGFPDQALARLHEAMALAHDLGHPYSLAMARFYAARLHQARGERQAVHTQASALVALAAEQHQAFWETQGLILQGWARTVATPEARLAQMHQGLHAYQATGAAIGREYFLLLLAEVACHAGLPEAAQTWVDEVQAVVQATGARYCEAELLRLQGALRRQAGAAELQVESDWQQARIIARRQQTKAWELRVAMSLSRLWQCQGKRTAAQQLLAEVYGSFTEGWDTADLQEARALLEALT
jgi:predicted ATPase